MRNTKSNQIQSAIIEGNHVTVDISTSKHKESYMECDLEDFISWRDEPSYGRIGTIQPHPRQYPYATFRVYTPGKQKHKLFHRHVHPEYKSEAYQKAKQEFHSINNNKQKGEHK